MSDSTSSDVTKKKVIPLIRTFLDPRQPWVLVPNGSFQSYFDWVPINLRVGPWSPTSPFFLIIVCISLYIYCPENIFTKDFTLKNDPHLQVASYPQPFTTYWSYNIILFLFMSYLCVDRMIRFSPAIIVTYTIQSWCMNCIRHGIHALAPFLYDNHVLLQINSILRFPALVTASVVFIFWNFAIIPFLHFVVLKKDTQKSRSFYVFNFRFYMNQIHLCNIIYAILNCLVTGPRGSSSSSQSNYDQELLFDKTDFWFALLFGIIYALMYVLIFDRLGVHLYPVFSPRSKYFFLSWMSVYGSFFGCYLFWNKMMEEKMVPQFHSLCIIICILPLVGFSAQKFLGANLQDRNRETYHGRKE